MSLFKRFLLQIAIGVLGLYLAEYFLEEVSVANTSFIFYGGLALGTVNFFIRPILCLITFPLRILTLGAFTFFINIAIVWTVGAMFPEINIDGWVPLLYTTLIVWVMEFILQNFTK